MGETFVSLRDDEIRASSSALEKALARDDLEGLEEAGRRALERLRQTDARGC